MTRSPERMSGSMRLYSSQSFCLTSSLGTAPSEEVKQKLWDEYNRIDPDMRSGDLVMSLEVGGGGGGQGGGDSYTVKSGDSLSAIGKHHGVAWREIYEANKDVIGDDPDKIRPGQTLRIPRK